ncbi:MAG: hypothetical protein ABWX70_00035, partial [Hyphomicrobium sp.]
MLKVIVATGALDAIADGISIRTRQKGRCEDGAPANATLDRFPSPNNVYADHHRKFIRNRKSLSSSQCGRQADNKAFA